MNTTGLSLLIPEKPDLERDAVAAAWEAAGGIAVRVGRFWDPPSLARECVRVYGSETFCRVLQERYGLDLQTPADDLITTISDTFLRRRISKLRVDELTREHFPLFIKSVIPKQIPSRVYSTVTEFADASIGLDPLTELLVSTPVQFSAEVRAFILAGETLDVALYEGAAHLEDACNFIDRLANTTPLPRAIVIDAGLLTDGTWVLIEFNAAWGAGLNGCDAARVLPAIAAASEPVPG